MKPCLLLGLLFFFLQVACADPRIPTDREEVILKIPKGVIRANFQLSNTSSRVERIKLAKSYLSLGSKESDPRYYSYALNVIKQDAQSPRTDSEALVIRATVLQHDHKFREALEDLNAVLNFNPQYAQAWLSKAAIETVIGRFSEAENSCKQLSALLRSVTSIACLLNVESLTGDATKSYLKLKNALALDLSISDSEKLWVLSILSEMAERTGNSLEAKQFYEQSLLLDSSDVFTTIAYADFLISNNDYQQAYELLKLRDTPDSLFLRRTLVEKKLELNEAYQKHFAILNEGFTLAQTRKDTVHLREQAYFIAEIKNDPVSALEIAEQNWEIQREAFDTLLLAKIAYLAKNTRVIEKIKIFVTTNNFQDIRLDRYLK